MVFEERAQERARVAVEKVGAGGGERRARGRVRESAPGIVTSRVCGIFRAARSEKAAGWRTVTAPPPPPPPTHPDFLNVCHKPRGLGSGRRSERKTLRDLSLRSANGRARGREDALSWCGAERRHMWRAREAAAAAISSSSSSGKGNDGGGLIRSENHVTEHFHQN